MQRNACVVRQCDPRKRAMKPELRESCEKRFIERAGDAGFARVLRDVYADVDRIAVAFAFAMAASVRIAGDASVLLGDEPRIRAGDIGDATRDFAFVRSVFFERYR